MKRTGNLYHKIIDIKNLELADKNASKGKRKQHGVILHRLNRKRNIAKLHQELTDKTYNTSRYTIFKIYKPKEREIFRLPYSDRIVHHAILQVLGKMFVDTFTADTYSCIKGRGLHKAKHKLERVLKSKDAPKYCLKLDIKKFYPSIDHGILKSLLLKKIKDNDVLNLLFGIIDSAPGLPIGNYLSQHLANLFMCYFDHWIKEALKIKHYYRYCDDLVLLDDSKTRLHEILAKIKVYLRDNLKLEVNKSYQIFPIAKRGIDFLGYKMYPTHTLLRPSIKLNFARKLAKGASQQTIASYMGWIKWCNGINLANKLLNNEKTRIKHRAYPKEVL